MSHAFVEIFIERKRKKKHSLVIEEMRNRPIHCGPRLKKKWTKTGTFVLVGKKKDSGKFYLVYLGLITRAFNGKFTGSTDNDSVRY